MGKFKRGKHSNWDPDPEIQTRKDREAVLAKCDEDFNEEEEESTPVAGSPMHAKLRDSSKQLKPKAGTGDVVGDAGSKGSVEPVVSQEDITKD